MNKKLFVLSAATLAMMSCNSTKRATTSTDKPVQEQNVVQNKKGVGINLGYMDQSVKPGHDFFRYVNGTWSDNTEIPSDRTRWGSFDELRQNTDIDALNILKAAVANTNLDPNSDQAKAVNMYLSFLDFEARDKAGIDKLEA